jgi:hypothetical protein
MPFIATCFEASDNYQLQEMTTLHGLTRQYYHAVTTCRRICEMYARTCFVLFLCSVFTFCNV